MSRRCASLLLLMLVFTAAAKVSAQSPFDSIMTRHGKCAVWLGIPGGSIRSDSTYNRCALDSGPVLITRDSLLPAPRVELTAHGKYTIAVSADGTVDVRLTRAWSFGVDSAWNARTLEAIRRWRFQPGLRNGVAVRSGFVLAIMSDPRNDTLPARLTWRYAPGLNEDSVVGTWNIEPKPAPFRGEEVERVHLALVRHLVATKILQPDLAQTYCLVMEDGDSIAHRRLTLPAFDILYAGSRTRVPTRYGCERSSDVLRVRLPRVYRTESNRAVLYPAGDYLEEWPFGFGGKTYTSWLARCVADVPPANSPRIECAITPDHSVLPVHSQRAIRQRSVNGTGDTTAQLTIIAMTHDAYQKDTLRVPLLDVRKASEHAVRDTIPDCAPKVWGAFTHQDSADLYIVKVEYDTLNRRSQPSITRVGSNRSPADFRGIRCNEPNGQYRHLMAFALGDLGDTLRLPVTLCIQERACRRSYVIDPARHTLATTAHMRFTLGSLRPETRVGQQLIFRIYSNRLIQGMVPLVVLRGGGRRYAWIPRAINAQEWEHGVTFAGGYPADTEVRVYLFILD
jgi:hypothetical protein